MSQERRFYVYAYFELGSDTPFYIGKGTGKRAYDHLSSWYLKGKKTLFHNKIRKMLRDGSHPCVRILHEDLTEDEALKTEMDLIAKYGRRDNGTGCLCNVTDGGEGMSGHVASAETRAKMSAKRRGRVFSAEHRAKLSEAARVRSVSREHLARMTAALLSKPVSEETRRKRSEATRGRAKPAEHVAKVKGALRRQRGRRVKAIRLDTGEEKVYEVIADVAADGFHPQSVGKCCLGKQSTHKGHVWSYVQPNAIAA